MSGSAHLEVEETPHARAYCAGCGFAVDSPAALSCGFCARLRPENGDWPKDQLLETAIERLRLERRIGEGAYGIVYLAVHKHLGVQRAVKVLSGPCTDERDRERFRREAEVLAAVDHPNIVHTYDFGLLADDRPFMVQELLEGRTLKDRLREGALPEDAAAKIARQIAAALAYFERPGSEGEPSVVHRDVKPANVMLREAGPVCLFDFGIAWIEGYSRLTAPDRAIGTFKYMAPEQLKVVNGERPVVDGRTDVFALGVVLFEMLTGGRHPFMLEHDDAVALMGRIYRKEMGSAGASPELMKLLVEMLAYDRESRPRPGEVERRLGELGLQPVPEPRAAPRSSWITLVAVAAMVIVVALAFFIDREPSPEAAPPSVAAIAAPRVEPRAEAPETERRKFPNARLKKTEVKVGVITEKAALAAIETQRALLVSCSREAGTPLTLFVTIFRDGTYEQESRPRGPAAEKFDRCLTRGQFRAQFSPLERGEFAVVTYEVGE